MTIRALRHGHEFDRFADFPAEVYRGNPHWAPPNREHALLEAAGRVPQAEYSDIQSFWAERDGRICAILTAVVDRLYLNRWKEPLGHLVSFEALPDCDAEVEALFRTACGWLHERGCRAARYGILFGWQLPLTVDAYDVRPTVFHTCNPPYYHRYLKNAGFRTEKGCVEYRVSFTGELTARYEEMAARAENAGVTLRPWDFTQLDRETTFFTELLDETFAQHWSAPPMPRAVTCGLTIGLQQVLIPDLCWFAEVAGRPAGFVFSLPDLNQSPCTHGVLLIIGVRQACRGRGINLALAARSYLAMIGRGYKSASYTVVLDDNWPSRRTAEKLGCRVERNFVVYRRDWDVLDPPDRR